MNPKEVRQMLKDSQQAGKKLECGCIDFPEHNILVTCEAHSTIDETEESGDFQ